MSVMKRTRGGLAVAFASAALAACAGGTVTASGQGAASAVPTPRELGSVAGGSSQADFQFLFRTVEDYVSHSSVIFEGEVVSEARGTASTQHEVREQPRILQIKVKEVLKGFQPTQEQVRVDDFGWLQVRGQPERVHRPGDYLRVEVGDVGIFNVSTPDKRVYGFTNHQAVFLLHDGQVRDTDRPSPFVREVESLSADELRDRIRGAAGRLGRSATPAP